jgi:hypothetical protein
MCFGKDSKAWGGRSGATFRSTTSGAWGMPVGPERPRADLLRLAPDVILANGSSVVRPMQQATRIVPIIFIGGADPVGDGFVESLSHPGGNLTGFTVLEESIGAKLLELLKEIAPQTRSVAVMINPDSPSHRRLFDAAAAVAKELDVDVVKAPVRESGDIEAAMTKLERTPGQGLIVPRIPPLTRIAKRSSRWRLDIGCLRSTPCALLWWMAA